MLFRVLFLSCLLFCSCRKEEVAQAPAVDTGAVPLAQEVTPAQDAAPVAQDVTGIAVDASEVTASGQD